MVRIAHSTGCHGAVQIYILREMGPLIYFHQTSKMKININELYIQPLHLWNDTKFLHDYQYGESFCKVWALLILNIKRKQFYWKRQNLTPEICYIHIHKDLWLDTGTLPSDHCRSYRDHTVCHDMQTSTVLTVSYSVIFMTESLSADTYMYISLLYIVSKQGMAMDIAFQC